MRKVSLLICIICVILALTGCSEMSLSGTESAIAGQKTTEDLQILVSSDVHGRYMPYDYGKEKKDMNGSLTQMYTAIKELRTDKSILVDVGDSIKDNKADKYMKMKHHPYAAALNYMGYDVWTLGNHDFYYGLDKLKNIIKQVDATVLAGNVYEFKEHKKEKDDKKSKDEVALTDDYVIIERDNIKIGIIGMVTPIINHSIEESRDDYKIKNPLEDIRASVAKLKDEVDVIITALHMSYEREYDKKGSSVKDIARICPEIDVILAAHGHDLMTEMYENGILIVENDDKARSLIEIKLELKPTNNGRYSVVSTESSAIKIKDYKSDKGLEKVLNKAHKVAKTK